MQVNITNAMILIEGAAATVVLWLVSAVMALGLALTFAIFPKRGGRLPQAIASALINVSRGVPTSLYVLLAGVAAMHLPLWQGAPVVFLDTLPVFQVVALAVCLALAFGSAGHIAVLIRSSWEAVPLKTRQQLNVLDLGLVTRIGLALSECAPTFMPPLSARLIHHLHNTAFASLFPVADLFGMIKGAADTSARVAFYVSVGALTYLLLSWAIWQGLRWIEVTLAPQISAPEVRSLS